MIAKALDLIVWGDLEELVERAVPEGRRLDYKLTLPGGRDEDIREFLADVTSLANTDGGDLIYGVRDVDGAAGAVEGLDVSDFDSAILRLENIARDAIDPRLSAFQMRVVSGGAGKSVIIARISASLGAPHRVSYRGSSRFYARNSRGKYKMDTHELRQAFAASEIMPRRLRDLHERTLGAARGEDMPVKLVEGPSALVTIAPMSIVREQVDISVPREDALLPPRVGGGLDILVGFEGTVVLTSMDRERTAAGAFSINHRTGFISAGWFIGRERDGEKIVWPKYFVEMLPGFVASALARLGQYGLSGPWIVMASVRDLSGYQLILQDNYRSESAWQANAYLGDLMFERLETDTLTPLTDGFLRIFGIDNQS